MGALIAASAVFLGIHLFVSGTRVRGMLISKIGQKAYVGLFALASIGSLTWMVYAYPGAIGDVIWPRSAVLKIVALVLMIPSVLLVIVGATTPNPTAMGTEEILKDASPVRGIAAITRHPVLWGIAIWAFAHLLATGDTAALVLFGTFLVLALGGPFMIDAKRAARHPDDWPKFEQATSWLPFLAILRRRALFKVSEIGWWRIAVAVLVYLAIVLYLHEWIGGLSPLP